MKKDKKDRKEKLGPFLVVCFMALVPIVHFTLASIHAFEEYFTKLHLELGYSEDEIMKMTSLLKDTYAYYGIYVLIYIAFLLLMLVNYILYKKKKRKPLLILNIIVFVITIFGLTTWLSSISKIGDLESMLFVISSAMGLLASYKLYRKN